VSRATIRPFEPGDARAVEQIRAQVMNVGAAQDAAWHMALYEWLGRGPAATQMQRWVVDAGGQVVGQLAAIAQPYTIDGQRLIAHTPGDFMVLPGYGFHALLLMRTFFQTCANAVSLDQLASVIATEERLGAVPAGQLEYFVKPLNVANRSARFARPVRAGLAVASAATRALDGLLGATLGRRLEVQTIDTFDARFDGLAQHMAASIGCGVHKDSAYLGWRYGPGSPQEPVSVLAVDDGPDLLGYAVVRVGPEHIGYILDLVVRPGRRDVARALLRQSVATLWRQAAYVVRYRAVMSEAGATGGDLRRLGFFSRNGPLPRLVASRRAPPYVLLVKFADQRLHELARRDTNWAYSFGDSEPSFWAR
jgi:hypothetical protein